MFYRSSKYYSTCRVHADTHFQPFIPISKGYLSSSRYKLLNYPPSLPPTSDNLDQTNGTNEYFPKEAFYSSLCLTAAHEQDWTGWGCSTSFLFISSDSNHFTHSYIHQVDAHPCVGVPPEGLIDYCGLWVYRRPPAEGMRAITIGQINLHTLGHDK